MTEAYKPLAMEVVNLNVLVKTPIAYRESLAYKSNKFKDLKGVGMDAWGWWFMTLFNIIMILLAACLLLANCHSKCHP